MAPPSGRSLPRSGLSTVRNFGHSEETNHATVLVHLGLIHDKTQLEAALKSSVG
jgi:hypothetical protein